jgi:hypothetical protein
VEQTPIVNPDISAPPDSLYDHAKGIDEGCMPLEVPGLIFTDLWRSAYRTNLILDHAVAPGTPARPREEVSIMPDQAKRNYSHGGTQ